MNKIEIAKSLIREAIYEEINKSTRTAEEDANRLERKKLENYIELEAPSRDSPGGGAITDRGHKYENLAKKVAQTHKAANLVGAKNRKEYQQMKIKGGA